MMRVAPLVPALVYLGITGAAAQRVSPWSPLDGRRSLGLDLARSGWDGLDQSFVSGQVYASLRVPVTPTLTVVGEVPYARLAAEGFSGSAIGNLYVGIERAATESAGMFADLGVRLPTASQSGDLGGQASFLAAFSDFDRAEAWLDELWAAQGHIGYRRLTPGGFESGFAIGGTLWSSGQGEDEVLADYRVFAVYHQAPMTIGAEFTGRAILTESGLDFGQRTIHQLTLGAGLAVGALRPRLSVRIPLDADLKDGGLNHVLGLGVEWRF